MSELRWGLPVASLVKVECVAGAVTDSVTVTVAVSILLTNAISSMDRLLSMIIMMILIDNYVLRR